MIDSTDAASQRGAERPTAGDAALHLPRRTTVLRALLFAAALPPLLVLPGRHEPRFATVPTIKGDGEAPSFHREFLPASPTAFSHCATIVELRDGRLLTAWYGGTAEVARDVAIYGTLAEGDHWSAAYVIESRESAQRALGPRVKSIGNPVLYADEQGAHLLFVAILAGGWSGSTICRKDSPDGIHWSPARHVVTSPFANVGMLVRAPPVRYDDGTLAVPLYHELLSKWGGLVRMDRAGRVSDSSRIDDDRPFLQPWVIVEDAKTAVAVLRYSSRMPLSVTLAWTHDGGRNWSDVVQTPLVNRDAAVAGTRLADGSLLVFYNNSAWDRRDLSMARTLDRGRHWSRPHPLERDTTPDSVVRREYSYPFVIRTRDGRIHVVYTWQRTRIRHVVFNDAWVSADALLGRAR